MNRLSLLLAVGVAVIAAAMPAVAGSTADESGVPSLLDDKGSGAGTARGAPAYTVDQPAYRGGPAELKQIDLGSGNGAGSGFVVPAPAGPTATPDLPGHH